MAYFSLSDSDVNYKLLEGNLLESGDIPDVTGTANEIFKKSATNFDEKNLIWMDATGLNGFDPNSSETVVYKATSNGSLNNIINISIYDTVTTNNYYN